MRSRRVACPSRSRGAARLNTNQGDSHSTFVARPKGVHYFIGANWGSRHGESTRPSWNVMDATIGALEAKPVPQAFQISCKRDVPRWHCSAADPRRVKIDSTLWYTPRMPQRSGLSGAVQHGRPRCPTRFHNFRNGTAEFSRDQLSEHHVHTPRGERKEIYAWPNGMPEMNAVVRFRRASSTRPAKAIGPSRTFVALPGEHACYLGAAYDAKFDSVSPVGHCAHRDTVASCTMTELQRVMPTDGNPPCWRTDG